MRSRSSISPDPLPKGIPLERIYADFFGYVYKHTMNFFRQREFQGTTIWENLKRSRKIEFVIAHPNGWTLHEQVFLRKAAVAGGLIHQNDAARMVHMITEGEASVHFVVSNGGLESRLQV